MASLKRLLHCDEDEADLCDRRTDPSPPRSFQDGRFSDKLVLADQSWADIWGGLLGQNSTHADTHLDQGTAGTRFDELYYTEESIEEWAEQDLISFDSFSAPLEPGTVSATSEDSMTGITEELCYGMIYRKAVKLVGDMSQVDAKLRSGNKTEGPRRAVFGIGKSFNQIFLTFSDGTEFALLNNHTEKVLDSIIGLPSVRIEAFVDLTTLRETIGRATKASDATLNVNLNVYGSKEVRKQVGCCLSAGKIYLQHPYQHRPGSIYDNPHFLVVPGILAESVDLKPHRMVESMSRSDDVDGFRKAVADVYASLRRSSCLKRLVGDSRLTTSLLPHQQEALDFMMQRENGPVPPEFSLWQRVEVGSEIRFCHVITKTKSSVSPLETGGGVLADEMGMGKSLSILSLIANTLENAIMWASNGSEPLSNGICAAKHTSRATLVIVPSALLLNSWLSEIKIHLDGTLESTKYHGPNREKDVAFIANSDIVLTTYRTLAADFTAKKCPLHEIAWFRVVLDEAHIIRRQATTFYRTVSELSANSRWCLTGTPIQNRLEDIGALFAFIRATPFDSMAMFRRFVVAPFEEGEKGRAVGSQPLRLLLDSVCLRRSKDLLDLPAQQDRTHTLEFSREEREQYELTKKNLGRAIRQNADRFHKKSVSGMFQVMLQLRILCNHGTFQDPFSWVKRNILDEKEAALCSAGQNGEICCSSCRQSMPILGTNHVYRTYAENCAHVLCLECLDERVQEHGPDQGNVVSRCPLCHPHSFPWTLDKADSHLAGQQEQQNDNFVSFGHSSKMAALISDVKHELGNTKSIIFSCWTRTLNLVARHLRQHSIPFGRIDGDCPLARRQRILDDFAMKPSMPVLIMTTGTGAFGLNLTAANRVFIIEPQWNPSVENQAVARALRLGQEQSVLITRYVMNRTVEQEMRSQQDRKLKLAKIGWE